MIEKTNGKFVCTWIIKEKSLKMIVCLIINTQLLIFKRNIPFGKKKNIEILIFLL
jgi:hypothetical protein